jgi:hypothetical protein
MKFKVNDTVQLLVDIQQDGLEKNRIGVIVFAHEKPIEAYEVEFCDEHGATVMQILLKPEQIAAICI